MTHTDILLQYIHPIACGEPIYLTDLARIIADQTGLSMVKAKLAASTAMSRLVRKNKKIRKYQNGIFFKTRRTPFGKVIDIRKDKLLINRYLEDDNGYITGHQLLHNMGLTTQIPNHAVWVSNHVKRKIVHWAEHITVIPAKTILSKENIYYFSFLDALMVFPQAPVDAWEPYKILAKYIVQHKLSTTKLLEFSSQYYPDSIYKELCKTMILGGERHAVA